jgi:hypothetical protein
MENMKYIITDEKEESEDTTGNTEDNG